MEEIIEQISQIDAIAYENDQKNKSILSNEKLRLENDMKTYHDQELSMAEKNAKIIDEQVVDQAKREYKKQDDKLKQISSRLEENYFKIEKKVLNEIFEKLFTG